MSKKKERRFTVGLPGGKYKTIQEALDDSDLKLGDVIIVYSGGGTQTKRFPAESLSSSIIPKEATVTRKEITQVLLQAHYHPRHVKKEVDADFLATIGMEIADLLKKKGIKVVE